MLACRRQRDQVEYLTSSLVLAWAAPPAPDLYRPARHRYQQQGCASMALPPPRRRPIRQPVGPVDGVNLRRNGR
jgi:hypothetical protein